MHCDKDLNDTFDGICSTLVRLIAVHVVTINGHKWSIAHKFGQILNRDEIQREFESELNIEMRNKKAKLWIDA